MTVEPSAAPSPAASDGVDRGASAGPDASIGAGIASPGTSGSPSPSLPTPRDPDGGTFVDPALSRLATTARAYAAVKDSANTARAYASDQRLFARWCRRRGVDADRPDPQAIGLYLAALAIGDGVGRCAVSTIERKLAALCAAYRTAGTPLDRGERHIAHVMAGIRRTHARPPRQKEAVLGEDLLAMLATLPTHLRLHRQASRRLASGLDVRGAERLPLRLPRLARALAQPACPR